MSSSIFGRALIVPKTTKSGGALAKGDAVVDDDSNDNAVTTDTSGATTKQVGIVVEENGIANNATGRVQFGGHVGLVNVDASVTRGHYGKTHTVAKQATDAGASRVAGCFCIFTTGGTTPEADLFGLTDSGLGGTLTDHTHAATGSGANGGGASLAPTSLILPTSLGTTTGQADFDATNYVAEVYDSQRERAISAVGWVPHAWPTVFSPVSAYTTALALAANGGSLAVPMVVSGHMLLQDVRVANTDTGTQRTWGWDLYVNDLNNGNAGENTARRVAASSADETFTPSGAASVRAITASGAPVYLAPGIYWLVVQNRHATSTFGVGTQSAAASLTTNNIQTKTTTNPNGATLDLILATWTKSNALAAVVLKGRVLGQSSGY